MQPAAPEISTCPICGGALEETSGGGLGCMICLLRVGILGEDPAGAGEQDLTPKAFGENARFGVYEIESHPDGSLYELGRGAMGVTYRAIDTSLQRKVALKIIKIDVATRSAEARERFMREARAAAALRHENIATVFQFGICEETGQYFYAMELIEGETLDERVGRTGPLGVRTTIDIAQQVTAALAAAEKHGLVHRDLKPANLMLVSPDDETAGASTQRGGYNNDEKLIVKIIDFGLAKALNAPVDPMRLTRDRFVGTPAFASPEQFEHSAVDVRSDIYSLGETLWFALTGKPPFAGHSVEEIHRAQQSGALPIEQLKAARVPSRLRSLLKSMLAVEPAARPGTHELAVRLQRCSAQASGVSRVRVALTAAVILILAVSAFFIFRSVQTHPPAAGLPSNLAPPEKSIAVLPFENLSRDPNNAYFADGIQEEILTRLANIAGLKVISRTSTQHYQSKPRNLAEIAKQLGVAHILEGSAQKTSDQVRVNVQLVNAQTDSNLWAETYDRKLTDIFSVESEIAQGIAEALQAKLTGREEQVIATKPTDNVEAYDGYLRGLAYSLKPATNTPAYYVAAEKHLREAVRLDPKFALAWALLSYVDARGYSSLNLQPTVALREEIRQAADTALTLQPNLGEALHAKGFYHYACLKDYDTAARYFERARHLLPNNSRIPQSLAYIARRRGEWDRSEVYFSEAERLDPRNVSLLAQHALSYIMRRRFPEALRKLDEILDIIPDDANTLATKAAIAQAEGDLPRASALLAPLRPAAGLAHALETQVYQAILERRPAPVIARLKEILATPDPALGFFNGELRFWLGWAQEVAGDHAAAYETWRQARSELEPFLKEQTENRRLVEHLALTTMGLGDKVATLRLAERAMAANPIERDAVSGPAPIDVLARVAARMGEPDRAIAALQKVLSVPGEGALAENIPLTPALLKLDPMFDPLRNDPRFQKLCEEKQPVAPELATQSASEKSIAVLPFENLSPDPENAYFADGIQEEILTRLAKIADLKVISRTSTQKYKSSPDNLREIAQQLGVANILEGSVQKAADQVRVNVQLVNAQTDSHLWAETYDRKLTDIFSVESEIAQGIAEALQAKLTGREEQALAVKPTNNSEAYDAYLRGLAFEVRNSSAPTAYVQDLVDKAIGFYERAVQLDPNFALAWARLSRVNAYVYFNHFDATSTARGDAAKRALETAQKLEPSSAETLLALGYYQYRVQHDYGTAKTTFERVSKMLPGSSEVPMALGLITRREGHWDQSTAYWEQALALDPRNVELLNGAAETYSMVRQFRTVLKFFDRALDIKPNDPDFMAAKAGVYQAQGNLQEAARFIPEVDPQISSLFAFDTKILQLRLERNYSEAVRLLRARHAQYRYASEQDKGAYQVFLAITQRLAGDSAGAKITAEEARNILERFYKGEPNTNAGAATALSQALAVIGDKDSALKLAERAIILLPRAKDAVMGPRSEENLALIQTMFGENSRAISTLAQLLQTPYNSWFYYTTSFTPALLRLDPIWDPLRADPAFQKLCEEKQPVAPELVTQSAPEKSIAVLPFEDLSENKEHPFFADGVQDDIMTKLAKVADLKVINRTSVMQYRGKQDLHQIGTALGVAHLLEGTVRRSDGKVHVNAQLVDARTGADVWAEEYDRNLNEVFAIESDLAQSVANQLRANISARENSAMQEQPTSDRVAFDLYTRAKNLVLRASGRSTGRTDLLQAVDLLNQAVAHDPSFLQAYCQLASAHDHIYSLGFDRTSARLELAEAAIQAAYRLRADAGEAHLARAEHLYRGHSDYSSALAELKAARQTLPNDARIFQLMGFILRRQGRWDEATRNLERALELDPRNTYTLQQMAWQYLFVRRYAEVKPLLARVLAIEPNRTDTEVLLASVDFHWKADIRPFHQMIDSIRATNPSALSSIADAWITCALAERDPGAAANAIVASGENAFGDDTVQFSHTFIEGVVARMMKDEGKARSAFTAARSEQEKIIQAQPNYGPPLCVLGLIDAALGRKEEALREGWRAVELLPVGKDSINGARMIKYLAMIAAWSGDKDLACEQLASALRYPTWPSYGELKLLPFWDPLRGDPRFEKIVASLAPR